MLLQFARVVPTEAGKILVFPPEGGFFVAMNNLKDFLENFKGNKVLMTIYPHPDDETMAAGGLLMTAKALGYKTIVVCLTLGEAGQNHAPEKGKTLAEIRKVELEKAIKILGVDRLELANFGDGKLRGDEKKWVPWVKKMIEKHHPGIVVTYDHSGIYGHPDHIALSLAISFPVLFWTTMAKDYADKQEFTKDAREFMTMPTHYLEFVFIKKWLTARAHASQKFGGNWPPLFWRLMQRKFEWYHQVDPKKKYPYKYLERTF